MSNKRKKKLTERNLKVSELILLVIAAVLMAGGGVYHAVLKNSQVSVARQITETQKMIDEHNEQTKIVQVKIDRRLNRHILRNDINEQGTELRPIPVQAVEIVPPLEPKDSAVASQP